MLIYCTLNTMDKLVFEECSKYDTAHCYKIRNYYIIVLKKLKDTITTENQNDTSEASLNAVYKGNKFMVVDIFNMFDVNKKKDYIDYELIYHVNKIVESKKDKIQYYKSIVPAFYNHLFEYEYIFLTKKYTGECMCFHPNGNIWVQGQHVNGIRTGMWKEYYDNGNLHVEVNLINGSINGEYKKWYNNNKIMEITMCKDNYKITYQKWHENGVLDTEIKYNDKSFPKIIDCKMWYESGQIRYDANDMNAKEHIRKYYYENGNICECKRYQHGLIHGCVEKFYKNGSLKFRINYENGKVNDTYILYHDNQQKRKEVKIINGTLDGLYKEWYYTGELKREINFINGRMNRVLKEWYPNSKIKIEAMTRNGTFDGEFIEYSERGRKKVFIVEDYKIIKPFFSKIFDKFKIKKYVENLKFNMSDEVLSWCHSIGFYVICNKYSMCDMLDQYCDYRVVYKPPRIY